MDEEKFSNVLIPITKMIQDVVTAMKKKREQAVVKRKYSELMKDFMGIFLNVN